ncbi:MAG: AIM24 family protein [Athalassotoga sp.]
MKYEIVGKPYYPILRISIEIGDRFFARLKSVFSFDVNTKWKEDKNDFHLFYVDTYSSELLISSSIYGDISYVDIAGQTLYVNSCALLAFHGDLTIDDKWGGAGEFFSDERTYLLKITGKGGIFIRARGIIYKKWISSTTFVNEENILAFEPSLNYKPYLLENDDRSFYVFDGGGNMYFQSRVLHHEKNDKK